MPVDTKLDYQLWERERVVLAANPTETTTVFKADGCQSIQVIMVSQDAATAAALVPTVSDGDLADGSDQIPSTAVPFVYPLAAPLDDQLVKVLEFKPAKAYFQISFAGVATSTFVEVIVIKQNCRAPGVGAEKPLVPSGLMLSSIVCMIPTDCVEV